MVQVSAPDAHERPPPALRVLFKKWQKASSADLDSGTGLLDFDKPHSVDRHATKVAVNANGIALHDAVAEFTGKTVVAEVSTDVYEINASPGLFIYPGLLSEEVQLALLDKMLHRDLSNPQHLTNVHLFHKVIYPGVTSESSQVPRKMSSSFFTMDGHTAFQPKDPTVHKSMSITQMLQRKLRWITLGGQYDWTNKVYPPEQAPAFPEDLARLLRVLFPTVDAQAAIVNLYTPGDTLSVHRDVSEECKRDLISISIGCDALFMVGNHQGTGTATVRLRSGDAVLMSGPSRYAWHAVPKVIANTCPLALGEWPCTASDPALEHWKGWMQSKRINLNVRQMKEV